MKQISIRVSDTDHARLSRIASQQTRTVANLTLHYVTTGLARDRPVDWCENDYAPDCACKECS